MKSQQLKLVPGTADLGPQMLMNSGRLVPLGKPRRSDISLRDIAHHLATSTRFAGAPDFPYSVAQHAVLVSTIAFEKSRSAIVALHALHHDSHEAYTGDIIGPMLKLLRLRLHERGVADDLVAEIKAGFDAVIYPALGLAWPTPFADVIHWADMTALATEFRDLTPDVDEPFSRELPPAYKRPLRAIKWDKAEENFLETHTRLCALAGVDAGAAR